MSPHPDDPCPYKKGEIGHRQAHRKNADSSYNQESGLEEILPSQPSEGNNPIDLILVASRTVR